MNHYRTSALSTIAALLLLAGAPVRSAPLSVDFESLGSVSCGAVTSFPDLEGLTFSSPAPFACDSGSDFIFASNGTTYIGAFADGGSASLTIAAGPAVSSFDLGGFDVAELLVFGASAQSITIGGEFASGGSTSATLTTDGTNDGAGGSADDFQTFTLTGFTGLSSVTFTSALGFGIDNLAGTVEAAPSQPDPVPAPLPLLLFGTGLAAMAALRRHR